MPGDPAECREHAKTCMKFADSATRADAREVFEDLARTWLQLACDLKSGGRLVRGNECGWTLSLTPVFAVAMLCGLVASMSVMA